MPIKPQHLSKEALGYQLHTRRELGMMLRREKLLAVFSDVQGSFPPPMLRYLRMFDRHARAGRFVRREIRVPIDYYGEPVISLTILYSLPDEVWRIDRMIELRRRIAHEPWTEELERLEGSLLGYTDEQNDVWIALPELRGTR